MLAYVGLCWPYVEPSWRLCWAYVEDMLAIWGLLRTCEAIYVEKIFRDNFLRIFPSREAKTTKKPTFFNIAKTKFSSAEGPKTL